GQAVGTGHPPFRVVGQRQATAATQPAQRVVAVIDVGDTAIETAAPGQVPAGIVGLRVGVAIGEGDHVVATAVVVRVGGGVAAGIAGGDQSPGAVVGPRPAATGGIGDAGQQGQRVVAGIQPHRPGVDAGKATGGIVAIVGAASGCI